MLKFRNLVLAAAAATIAVGGATVATTSPADATGWKRDRGVYVDVDRRGAYVDVDRRRRGVFGWFDRRDRRDGWFAGKRHKKHWKHRKHRKHDRFAEPAPRRYRPIK